MELEPDSMPSPDVVTEEETPVLFEAGGHRVSVGRREALAIVNIISAQLMGLEGPGYGGRRFGGIGDSHQERQED